MTIASRAYRARIEHQPDRISNLEPPRMLEVVAEDDPARSLGRADLSGWTFRDRRPVPTYRLVIGGEEMHALFTFTGGRFEPVST